MYSQSAKYYDLIYSQFKDYEKETQKLVTLIKQIHPKAKTILDVACGSGEHIKLLTHKYGFKVDGLDLDPEFIEIAKKKNPKSEFYLADMTDFKLSKKYDMIICLFSSIGYVKTADNLEKTLNLFREHLNEKGIIIVEPWISPENWSVGKLHLDFVNTDDLKICRRSYSDKKGNLSIVRFEYLVGSKDGISHLKEVHKLGLFTKQEMLNSFKEAKLSAEYKKEGLFGRGLYIAEKMKEK